ncbi:MAG: transcription antitermination factor NusB [Clostridia bacterium]|nr:transcription antitermination factor NusB [Clostridia bacterium]
MAKITRRAARECAVQLLYGYDFQKEYDKEEFFAFTSEEAKIETNAFAKDLYTGVLENLAQIDEKIKENLRSWSIERVSKISLAVMRVCAYELMFTDVPVPIAINEAIEIDKKFDKYDAPSFINGVLNAIAKGCRAE